MDTLSHYLWTVAIYWQHPKRWLVGMFGALPDLMSFGIFFVQRLLTGTMERGAPGIETIPQYVHVMYDITHSLVVFMIVAAVLWFVAREWFWLIWGWALHIIIDIPTHTAAFFPTPFLWPVSDFHLSGISWGVTWFMLMNLVGLIAVYVWLIWRPRNSQG